MSNTFVVIMGLATVFVGLICIIIVCMIMSSIVRALIKHKPRENKAAAPAPAAPATVSAANTAIADRDKVVVAISAAIAEEIGEDAGAIRILSLKKI